MEEKQDWDNVIIWDMPDGFTLKWDPHRKWCKWTAIGPEGRIGDFHLRVEAMIAIENMANSTKRV